MSTPRPASTSFLSNWAAKYEKERQQLVEKYGVDFDKPSGYGFTLNKAEQAVIAEWVESLRPEILAKQGRADPLGQNEPYYGATGGGLTYSFTPTSLGDILIVKESITGKELNVNDALNWHFYG